MKFINNFKDSKKYINEFLRTSEIDESIYKVCNEIRLNIQNNGDSSLKEYALKFDNCKRDFELDDNSIDNSFSNVSQEFIGSINKSINRSKEFHRNSMPKSWKNKNNSLGENIIPVDRALCYVPGGTAPLVSTVIMTVVPAKIAGVKEVIITSPAVNDVVSDEIVVAAKLAGADRIFLLGGAQSIFAFANGTDLVPRVDLICGPGNKYVTEAKRQVFGSVGIDGLYGPTETLVISDKSNDIELCAADLIAQAEHDVEATPILITDSLEFSKKVESEIYNQIKSLPRKEIIKKSFQSKGLFFIVENILDSIELANLISAEHVSILSDEIIDNHEKIVNAGGVFLGDDSAEVFGDYIAGPSHVMPTGGSARFNSALNVRHFLKYQPVINLSKEEVLTIIDDVINLAELEKLDGHAQSAAIRKKKMIGE
ncbi:MAG: histidinol dehydrogenase [Chloroflexi bacterium]|nr:histidinol dehydrogenase [Chloroflexota bacterium]|tara:strand:- start:948 stop:2225 length:1278 start_codon:yes stop_codon:yes gene_type:complete